VNAPELGMQQARDAQRVDVHVSDQAAIAFEPNADSGDIVTNGVDGIGRAAAELAVDRALGAIPSPTGAARPNALR
jgi:hypothetical protein